jgi:hypothetical protein
MRALMDAPRLAALMEGMGAAASGRTRVYFTGGATAVLHGWRASTLDADIKIVPDSDALYRALPALKERLGVNIELASPAEFIPELPGWRERSAYIGTHGRVDFLHYDYYAQALSKIERAHAQDQADVAEMLARGLVERSQALALFTDIEERLHRYPAIDPAAFRRRVEAAFR